MSSINEVSKKPLSINNKIVSIGKRIKLSISSLSIKVRNTINEFIHHNRYDSKVNFDSKATFSKAGKLIVSNKEKSNIDNEMKESNIVNSKSESLKINKLIISDEERNNIDNEMNGSKIIKFESEFLKLEIKKEMPEYNLTDEKKIVLNKGQSVLEFIELPNKDLIPIDEAINALHSCKQDSLLKSKMLLIDYITDMQFKPLMNNNVELLEKSNSNYLKEIEFDDTRYESVIFHPYEISGYDEKGASTLSNLNNDDTPIESNDNKVQFHSNEKELAIERDKFKSFLIETTKDISLLDRLSNGKNSYGYTFLAKVSNFLEDYNGIKSKENSNYFNKKSI